MMTPFPQRDDVLWTRVSHQGGTQWIRVVVEFVYVTTRMASVRPLFPGDATASVWEVSLADLQVDEPSFDQIDATYDGGEFGFA
jgi:hypothetical protein